MTLPQASLDLHAEWRRASDGKACIATRLAVTKDPCQHGYWWMCPNSTDLVKLLVTARDELLRRSTYGAADAFVRQVEAALPWLTERRRATKDRRHR